MKVRLIPSLVFIGLSLIHTVVGIMTYEELTERALWFYSAGIALFCVGGINLIYHELKNSGLVRIVSITSNLLMTIFVCVFGLYTFQRNVANPLAWLLIFNSIIALVLTIKRSSQ